VEEKKNSLVIQQLVCAAKALLATASLPFLAEAQLAPLQYLNKT
jgi:hypothetical protein